MATNLIFESDMASYWNGNFHFPTDNITFGEVGIHLYSIRALQFKWYI